MFRSRRLPPRRIGERTSACRRQVCRAPGAAARPLTQTGPSRSLRLEPKLLDERPPFLGIGFAEGTQRLRGLAFARINLKAEIGQPRAHALIRQRFNNLRRALRQFLLCRA
jgi:hypothetical protein